MPSFINIENSRSEEQKLVMEQIQEDKVCPFCPENLAKYHKNPILKEGAYWIITTNQWPYEGSKIHLFAIAKKHIVSMSEVDDATAAELFKLFNEAAEEHDVIGGTLAMRFGPTDEYASSVKHLHAHLIEPDIEDPKHQGIKFTVSKPSSKTE